MIGRCLRDNGGFGVVMIEEGEQLLKSRDDQLPSVAYTGTYCTIIDFDQSDNGMLRILVEGQVKFVIRDQYENADRLMMADVEFLENEPLIAIPDDKAELAGLLENLLEHEAARGLQLEVNFECASDVGGRLAELLPLPNKLKQRLLEMKNPLARLSDLESVITQLQEVG